MELVNRYFPKLDLQELHDRVEASLKDRGFFINDYALSNLILHVAIADIFTPGPMSAFGGFTGLGVTMGCVFWFMLSKSKAQREIGRIAFIPSLFGVNEPILFGARIVLNPIMFIPFVVFGGILSSIPFWFMSWGWLDCSAFTPPYVGVVLEGFLTNFDWRSIAANLVQLVAAIAVYYPFCKVYERRALEEEARAQAERQRDIFSAEDKEILDVLDLDF